MQTYWASKKFLVYEGGNSFRMKFTRSRRGRLSYYFMLGDVKEYWRGPWEGDVLGFTRWGRFTSVFSHTTTKIIRQQK